jgi:hypothetical protein
MIPPTKILAGLAALAFIAVPVAFAVQPENPGPPAKVKPDKPNPHKPDKPDPAVGYVFKGTYSGDGLTVAVTKGNKHVASAELVGTAVAFDLDSARITTSDTNGDGVRTIEDVAEGDKVLVQAKLPKSDPGAAPYTAKHLVDQTHLEGEPAPAPAP